MVFFIEECAHVLLKHYVIYNKNISILTASRFSLKRNKKISNITDFTIERKQYSLILYILLYIYIYIYR